MLGNVGNIEQTQPQIQQEQPEKQERIRRRKEYILNFPNGEFKLTFVEPTSFIFKDQKDMPFGNFTIHDLINYVAGKSVTSTARKLIEMSICSIKDTKPYNKVVLTNRSPFLNDTEIIVVLNRWLKQADASYKDKTLDEQLAIRKFICQLLEHSLKIIAIVSKKLDGTSDDLKKKLMRYSTEILYRLTTIVQSETSECMEKYGQLKESVELMKNIKEKMDTVIPIDKPIEVKNDVEQMTRASIQF